MIVDCERCPGQHLSPPACPSCVVRLLLDVTPARPAVPRADRADRADRVDRVRPAVERPVEVDLVRRTDDLGRELDTREQRAVAVLTAVGLVAGVDGRPGDRATSRRRAAGGARRFRTA